MIVKAISGKIHSKTFQKGSKKPKVIYIARYVSFCNLQKKRWRSAESDGKAMFDRGNMWGIGPMRGAKP